MLALEKNFAVKKKNCDKEGAVSCGSTLNEVSQIRVLLEILAEARRDKPGGNIRQLSRAN